MLHHCVVHDPTLVEVADELVDAVLASQGLHALDAVIGIAKDADLAVEILVFDPLEPSENLAKGLETSEI